MMDEQSINVLLIEDNAGDALLIRELLSEAMGSGFNLELAEQLWEGLDRLARGGIDVVLLDLSLPDSKGLETFTTAHAGARRVPIIVLTGLDDETVAIDAVREGAQDYLVKGRVDGELMSHAIRYAIERHKMLMELDGYAHTVSHDLNNPLAVIKVGSGTLLEILKRLQEKDIDREKANQHILDIAEEIDRSVIKAIALVNDLLSLAEAGQVPSDVSEVDVGEVVDRIISERQAEVEKKGIRIERSRDLGSVLASGTHVYQLFANLIGNAIRHNDSAEPLIEVSHPGDDGDGGHRFIVRDNGPGIPPSDIKNIFQPFYKVKSGGAGIGLATVEKIVKLYGGGIRVYNDNGACFEFVIRDFSKENNATKALGTQSTRVGFSDQSLHFRIHRPDL
jgi:signal transduction histidine kinase